MYKADVLKKLEMIPEDEPLFLLRGRDPLAAATVRDWVVRGDHRDVPEPKLCDAEEVAVKMAEYQPKKLPD